MLPMHVVVPAIAIRGIHCDADKRPACYREARAHLTVLSAIKLDDDRASPWQAKSREVRPDGCLASKMRILHLNSAQVPPQSSLCDRSCRGASGAPAERVCLRDAREYASLSYPPPRDPVPTASRGGERRGSSCRNCHPTPGKVQSGARLRRYRRAGGASVRCVPSQVGFLPLRLQAQKPISPAAAALYSIGENAVPLCEPSQNGCFLERPQAHHQ